MTVSPSKRSGSSSPDDSPPSSPPQVTTGSGKAVVTELSVPASPASNIAQSTVLVTDLANSIPDLKVSSTSDPKPTVASASTIEVAKSGPSTLSEEPAKAEVTNLLPVTTANAVKPANPEEKSVSQDSWADRVKGSSRQLKKKGTGFILPSGESCVKIPNSVIEKNKKAWDCFVLGQFYSDPPNQGTLHNIVNGIWSRYYRDISVSKMEGNAFLFRIPNVATRNRVINQKLWQIEGQTMFVANWEPGVVPKKPQLTSAPIWLELRQVPFQFFNEEGLEHIAGLVGDPKCLHPATANKTNLEVAKVFTIIDPRKPLPEAVNVQFDSGEICRVLVSSPWMPPVCAHCKEIGHSLKRCKLAPIICQTCKSTAHREDNCPRKGTTPHKKRYQKRSISKDPVRRQGLEKEEKLKAVCVANSVLASGSTRVLQI